MWLLALLPFTLQMITIGIDEAYFHYKRGLPKWERIGHPLDTLSFLFCLLITVLVPFDNGSLKIFIGFSVFSCLMITKDEFIHKEHCPGSENWLHAVLFILHPITLTIAGLIWPVSQGIEIPWLQQWLTHADSLKAFLMIQTVAISLFFLYQMVFWNFIWKNKPVIKF